MALPRMTAHTLTVLRALAASPDREMYGLEIVRAASLASGTVYPLLDRTEAAGWIKGRGEDIDPKGEGRPRRRYYRITPQGAAVVREAMERDAERFAALGIEVTTPEAPAGLRLPHGLTRPPANSGPAPGPSASLPLDVGRTHP